MGPLWKVAVDAADHRWLFAESASRVVVCAAPGAAEAVEAAANAAGVAVTRIGTVGGDRLVVDGVVDVPLAAARVLLRVLRAVAESDARRASRVA